MSNLSGNTAIKFIQGDSYEYSILVADDIKNFIKNVYFTCSSLQISEKMLRESEYKFSVVFDAKSTARYPPQETSYDVTIEFCDGNILSQTAVPLTIVKKFNPVIEVSHGD